MATLNVNRDVTDVFYRYKMPRIIAKVEGKGNGIKTVIVNMQDVAKSLLRPPEYPTKFFGCELGAQTQFDYKNERFIVNGSHEANKLQDLLDVFIKKFVLCPACDNPETKLTVKKTGIILQNCIACGHQCDVDLRHKITTFILKNPPEKDGASIAQATPGKKTKKGKKGKDKDEDDDEAGQGDGQNSPNGDHEANGFDEDDWGDDVTEEAVRKRMENISVAARGMTHTDDLEKSQLERGNIFYKFIKDKKENKAVTGVENEKEMAAEADRLDVKDKAPLILVELLLDENVVTQIKTYRTLLLRFTHANQKAQKSLLGAVEKLIGEVHKKELMPKVPHILKALFDLDIVEEEVLLDWDKKASKKYVTKEISKEIHSKAAPFIEWLKNAEEESSSDEEDELEVVYSHTGKVGTEVVKEVKAEESDNDSAEDGLDIDNI